MNSNTKSLVNQQLTEKMVLQGKINNLLQQQRCAGEQLEELMSRRDELSRELADINRQIQDLRDYQHQLFTMISKYHGKLDALTERKTVERYNEKSKASITRG